MSQRAYDTVEAGGYCSFTFDDERWLDVYTDTDVRTSTNDED